MIELLKGKLIENLENKRPKFVIVAKFGGTR
jgi:hypothetical protein